MDTGYQALREGAAWLDLSARGRLRVRGEDRARWLHAMVSNHVEQLQPGRGCYAFLLNAQGRILGDLSLLCFEGFFLLDTEPETRRSSLEHLDRHIIADDVTLEDVSGETTEVGVEGPESAGVLRALGAPVPEAEYSHAPWGTRAVARLSTTGAPGFALIAPRDEHAGLVSQLESAGAPEAGPEAARTVRIELGRPRYGEDLTDKHLPQETQLLHALHFNKGCYLGQEIVERIRSRGGVHRFLVRLAIETQEPPPPGAKITAGGRDVGEITSAVYSPAAGRVVALGYVRLGDFPANAPLEAAGSRVEITASPVCRAGS
jgi:tRNA-modifying protein YgfZ